MRSPSLALEQHHVTFMHTYVHNADLLLWMSHMPVAPVVGFRAQFGELGTMDQINIGFTSSRSIPDNTQEILLSTNNDNCRMWSVELWVFRGVLHAVWLCRGTVVSSSVIDLNANRLQAWQTFTVMFHETELCLFQAHRLLTRARLCVGNMFDAVDAPFFCIVCVAFW